MNFSLFEEPSSFDRAGLGRRLRELASENIWIGTSSWKYEGWLGQIYTPSRYRTRGKFSKKLFEETCLAEYASVRVRHVLKPILETIAGAEGAA